MDDSPAALLSRADPGDFVELSFEDRRDYWHVNDRIVVGESGSPMEDVLQRMLGEEVSAPRTIGLVFQMADASHEWLVVTISRGRDEEASIERAMVAGKSPDSREPVEGDIAVHGVAPRLTALKDDDPIEGPGDGDE